MKLDFLGNEKFLFPVFDLLFHEESALLHFLRPTEDSVYLHILYSNESTYLPYYYNFSEVWFPIEIQEFFLAKKRFIYTSGAKRN